MANESQKELKRMYANLERYARELNGAVYGRDSFGGVRQKKSKDYHGKQRSADMKSRSL
ncbi:MULTISPECIES: hypothetical protein [Bacillus cereus group]|uniref:hypothetical protein n=1 Tax=Bacillus cereus group TaxID=86661 RepID=UPI0022E773B8|nr:hypothetical protein [Bacillus cereus group sp. LD121LC]MDA1747687.1 hypothetical protein [Bacillus cereus group sp. LD121LC]